MTKELPILSAILYLKRMGYHVDAEDAQDEYDALRLSLRRAMEALDMLEWYAHSPLVKASCPTCGAYCNHGHTPDCKLNALLADLKAKYPAPEEKP